MNRLLREIQQRTVKLEGEDFKQNRFRNSYLAERKKEAERERISKLYTKFLSQKKVS